MDRKSEQGNESRREFIRKLAYMPPAIATLTVLPAFHASGSGLTDTRGNNGVGNNGGAQPPGNSPIKHGPGTRRGKPGNRGRVR